MLADQRIQRLLLSCAFCCLAAVGSYAQDEKDTLKDPNFVIVLGEDMDDVLNIVVYVKPAGVTEVAIRQFSERIKKLFVEEKRIGVYFFNDLSIANKFLSNDNSISEPKFFKSMRGVYILSRKDNPRETFKFLPNGTTEAELESLSRNN